MGLGQLTPPEYLGCSWAEAVFNDTWGHYSPEKNTSYKGKVRFIYTDHSQYGCQAIIIGYDFKNLMGPYIHDVLFNDVCDNKKEWEGEEGVVYERELTFRNYRFYYGKIKKLLSPID